MRLAFIIQAHEISNALLYTIRKISSDSNSIVFLHFDKKYLTNSVKKRLGKEGVELIDESIDVKWGDISQFAATVALIRSAMNVDFDYISFISGEDVIIGGVDQLRAHLALNHGREFFGVQQDYDEVKISQRIKYRHPEFFFKKNKNLFEKLAVRYFYVFGSLGLFLNPTAPPLPKLYKGSNWFTITRAAANEIVEFVNARPLLFCQLKGSFCADEILLPTILMNSSVAAQRCITIDDNLSTLRYIDWHSGPDFPKILDLKDFDGAKISGCYFARKVSKELTIDILRSTFGS